MTTFAQTGATLRPWGSVAALTALNRLIDPPGPAGATLWASALWVLQRLATGGFALLAAAAALRHWRNDLVEGRRRLRLFVVVSGVAYTLGMLAARLWSPQGRLSAPLAMLDLLLLAMLGVLAWRLLTVTQCPTPRIRTPPPLPCRRPTPLKPAWPPACRA